MFKLFRRWWRYLTARLTSSFEEKADPKVQLEQAIAEAQDQHRRLKEQAANVIAHQKQTEIRLNRTMGELEKVNGNARQAVLMADEASKGGDTEKAMQYTATAESFANRLITLEREVEDLKQLHLQSTDAANQAKAAVQQNSTALQQKLGERQKLLSQLDQAKMQEQMNTAMASLSETVGQDVPTLDEVRDKIESRYARAKGMSELTESSVESRMLEVEQAILEAQDQHRRLKEQAANVIANQKQTEMRLSRTLEEFEKVNANARQAVLMADEASKSGEAEKAMQYTATAESFANRLITLEREVEDLKQLHLQSTDAANQAKAAVQQNSSALQQKLAERQKLLSQLDQAKMQEQMNTAMASLSETVGQDVPTLDEVRDKIESRYARAKGMSELTESSVESRMLEVEQASMNSEAQARLSQIRAELGLAAGDTATGTGSSGADGSG